MISLFKQKYLNSNNVYMEIAALEPETYRDVAHHMVLIGCKKKPMVENFQIDGSW
jgi:hypothetical protein